jgi:hypothetical protein
MHLGAHTAFHSRLRGTLPYLDIFNLYEFFEKIQLMPPGEKEGEKCGSELDEESECV